MSKKWLLLICFLSIIGAVTFAKATDELIYYRADQFNLIYALPSNWETTDMQAPEGALALGIHPPQASFNSMILFSIPKEGNLDDELSMLRENAEAAFLGEQAEDTVYIDLIVDGMPAIHMREIGYTHQILFINDEDRYIALVYLDPGFLDDPDYDYTLETVQSSIALLHNTHPYVSNAKDYLVLPYQEGVQVIGYTGNDRRIRIPDEICAKPVLSIGSWAFSGLNIEHIVLPDSVKRIGNNAFSMCANLRSISLPNQLSSIGDLAFELCAQLYSISIPDSVVSIGNAAFIGCMSLQEMKLPSSLTSFGSACLAVTSISEISIDESNPFYKVSNNVLYSHDGKVLLFYPQGRIDEHFSIPEGVEQIGDFAFAQFDFIYYALQSVHLPSTLLKIGQGALDLMSQKYFLVPSNVVIIQDAAFPSNRRISFYGMRGTAAEAYANSNGFAFIDIVEGQ